MTIVVCSGAGRSVLHHGTMKNLSLCSLIRCSAAWLLCACANGTGDTTTFIEPSAADSQAPATPLAVGETAPAQANQCGGAVDRNLANLAGAAAEELGRWKATRDFQIAPDGASLELSPEGRSRCSDGCKIVEAVLGLQRLETVTPDNDPGEFAAALVTNWERQNEQELAQPSAVDHELTRIGSEASSCGGSTYWFEAERANCSGQCGITNPESLRHELLFAGYPDNRFLEFQSALDFQGEEKSVVGVDPTYGPGDDEGGSSNPTCQVACVKVSLTNIAGQCCACNGVVMTFVKSQYNAITFLCQ